MTTLSDARGTSTLVDSYDGYIEQIQQVLRVNHVPFGTPFDFLILAQTLENNSQLRNDLALLLQSFMEGEKKITHRTALGIIAVASGGPDFTTSSNGISPPRTDDTSQPAGSGNQQVNVLVDLLMSVGGRTQTTPQNSGSHFDSRRPEPIDDETHQAALSNHEPDSRQFADTHSDDPSALEAVTVPSNPDWNLDLLPVDSPPQDSSPDSGTEDPLVESLTRLELNALQVKHYLDSIDQRISRIEPRLDSLPAYVPPPTTPHPPSESHFGSGNGHVPDGTYSAIMATGALSYLSQDEPPVDLPPTATKIPSDMRSLLNNSSRRKHSQKKFEVPIITAAALVLLLLLYWGFNQNTQSPGIGPAKPSLAQIPTIPPSSSAPAVSVNPSRPSENGTTRPSPGHIAAAGVVPEVHHRPLRNSTPADLSDASYPSPAPTTGAEDSDDSTLTPEPLTVSPGVMAANVLSAPQPSYPLLASLTRMRGEVIMKATISKDGMIENVHVIKGHRLLRGAATNAVRSWRYRPYLVNGRPVEVATTVSVDFDQTH